jgi:HEAT repeat protein
MGEVQVPVKAIVRFGIALLLLLVVPHGIRGQQPPLVADLLRQFESETVFWRQIEVAKAIAAANDKSVLPKLEPWLTHPDRHLRGNAAFVFARLGDPRGFEAITAILSDNSERPAGEGFGGSRWSLQQQIRQDRYYAAHLLGDLKDPRAIPILAPLLTDPDVNYIVPWSLGQIGGPSAISPLIGALKSPNPSIRVLSIYALVELKAVDSLPQLRQLLDDPSKSNFGKQESVAEAAQAAIAKLQSGLP